MSGTESVKGAASLDQSTLMAWGRFIGAPVAPERVTILKRDKNSSVYRLAGLGPRHRGIVAKRLPQEKARIERAVYEGVLARLRLSSIEYHGCIEEDAAPFAWLFLGDVGDERFSPLRQEHRLLAADWLGKLHVAVHHGNFRDQLDDRGPDFYRRHLDSIIDTIPRLQASSSIPAEATAILKEIGLLCHQVESCWGDLVEFCEPVPRTLVHGDCLPKNVHIQPDSDREEIAFFDWGGSGWGVAATDLGLLALPYEGPPSFAPDYATYLDRVQLEWEAVQPETVKQLAQIGQLFWALKVIDRSFPDFDYPPPNLVSNFRLYASTLARSIEETNWGPQVGPADLRGWRPLS